MTKSFSTRTPLVGRFSELALLTERLKDAMQGHPVAVLMEGDPGVGKTALIHELGAQAERVGARVFYGSGKEFERALPYAPLSAALEGALATLGPEGLAELAGPSWHRLRMIFPTVAGAIADGADTRAHAYIVLARTLIEWSAQNPVVLALDDAHWADEGTLELLSVLAGRLRRSRCLLIVAYRGRPPELTPRITALFDRLVRDSLATKVRLEALDEHDCALLVSSLLDGRASDDLTRSVFEATGGNPFFVEEIVRSLADAELVPDEQGRLALGESEIPVPSRASSIVFHRIFSLGPEAMAVARVVSATRSLHLRGSVYRAVAAASGLSTDTVGRSIDALIGAGVLCMKQPDKVEFAHPIVQSLVYQDLGTVERRRIHGVIAERLRRARDTGEPVGTLDIAVHVAEAARVGDREAIELLAAAGDETLTRVPAVAAGWYERAEYLVDSSNAVWRAEIQAHRARALFLADLLPEAVGAGRDALSALSGRPRAEAAGIVVAALTGLGRLEDALREVDRALDAAAGDMEGRARGNLLAHRMSVLLYLGRIKEAEACGAHALALAEDDPAARVRVIRQLAQVAFVAGKLGEHRRRHSEALALAGSLPAGVTVSVLSYGAICVVNVGELAGARALLEEAERLSEEHGTLVYRPLIDQGWVTVRWFEGRWDDSIARCQKVINEAERTGRLETVGTWATLAAILVDRGDFAQARRLLAPLQTRPEGANRLAWPYLMWSRARLERLGGRPERAIDLLEHTTREQESQGMIVPPVVAAEMVEACLEAGRSDASSALDRLARLASELDTAYVHALLGRARLLASEDVDAGRGAHRIFLSLGMPFEVARTELALGRATQDPTPLVSAYKGFEALEADVWRRRAGAALREIGEPVPRRRRRSRSGLSDLEMDVCRLVADGLSNKEIAVALALSPRTVESYVSRIYVKSGCGSRTELASAVVRGKLRAPGLPAPQNTG